MRSSLQTLLIALLVTLATPATATETRAQGFVVIVHPGEPLPTMDRKFLSDVFLKKITRWGDDSMISPVDLGPRSAVRAEFSEDVLNRSVSAVRNYWRQSIFSGRDVPPPELDSDSDVVAYVVRTPGAIGYVSTSAELKGARLVQIR